MKKRLLCLLLALVMTVGLLPLSALAAEDVNDASEPVTQAAEEAEEQPMEAAPEEEQTVEAPKVESEETSVVKVEIPADAKAMVNCKIIDVNTNETIYDASNREGHTVSVPKTAKMQALFILKGYDECKYTFKHWEINGYSGTNHYDDTGYTYNVSGYINSSIYASDKFEGTPTLLDEYIIRPVFEEKESTEPASNEVKIVIDLTDYNGKIDGEFPFSSSSWSNMPLEAGKKNEILISMLANGIDNGEITLTDAADSFIWTMTGLSDNFIKEDLSAKQTVLYKKLNAGDKPVITAASNKLLFTKTTLSTMRSTKNAWGGKTIVLTPDFNSLDESKAFKPLVSVYSGDEGKGTVTAAFGRNNGTESSTWVVTATPKNEWYKLDYVADEAGNKFASEDGKTATITVNEADQKFTAYFTAAVDPMYDETPAKSVNINMTVSNDGIPLLAADGETILSHKDITVPYFDLANYGLDRFYRYGTEYGWGAYNDETVIERPTALHAYIYIIERYYMGLPESECGTGESGILDYNKNTDVKYMDGTVAYSSGRTAALLPTGTATSLYMKYFWGHDENLMYFRNHEYPLMSKGWGSTCDYILLSDGDRLDVAMFSNWDFYKDGGFNQFSQDEYYAMPGETITTSTFKAGTSAGLDGESPALEPISGLNVAVYDENWDKVADVTGDGTYSYTFDKAGTYYFMATDTGAKSNDAHYAPATARVIVVGEPEKDAEDYYLIGSFADMFWLQAYVNEQGHYDVKAKLTADIDISNLDWQGLGENVNHYNIGNQGYKGDRAFSGEIDGQGHTLTVSFTGSPLVNLLTGTVKNLTIKGKSEAGTAFVRYLLYNGRIENCVNYASVSGMVNCAQSANGATGAFAAAACVGPKLLYHTTGIVNCVNHGDVQTTGSSAGGILGVVVNSFQGNFTTGTLGSSDYKVYASIEVTGCKNYGAVSAANSNAAASGIVGSCSMADVDGVVLADCENHGAVSAPAGGAAAGILGQQNSEQQTISRCLNTGTITGTSYAAGITGASKGEPTLIESCANTGKITGQYAGGIVAVSYGEITDCYNTGDVTGSVVAGGIAGRHDTWQFPNTHNCAVGKVSNCYTTGKVTGSSDNATIGAAVGKLHTGGIVSLEQSTYRDFQVYALEGTCAQLVGEKGENAKDCTSFVTEAELKSDEMLEKLGENFKKTYISNNGYPLLSWQSEDPITGLVNIDGKIMYYTNGEFDATKKGVARMADGSDSNWYYVENGVFKEATGIAQRADGSNNNWYYVQNGIYKKATGIARYADGSSKNWYYVEKGQYKKSTGIARYADGSSKDWYYVQNGKYIKATGIAQYADGSSNNWYFVKNGKYTKTTGLTQKADGSSKNWYYVSGGRYRPDYTGLAPRIPDGKLFYVKNGVYRNNFNGTVKYQGKTYTVKNGRAV